MTSASWFDVDKEGLSKLVERRGKAFIVYELLQNAWDCAGVTFVSVRLEPVPAKALVHLVVEDDHPDGFSDISHAYTLFAESEKKGDSKRRGRFNLGEKLVLSLCEHASIVTTTGSVRFDADGRSIGRRKTVVGSRFDAYVRMTREELAHVFNEVDKVISPVHVATRVNGLIVPTRRPVKTIPSAILYTDVADQAGFLRRKYVDTEVQLFNLRQGEKAVLYEMGIPVMEMGDDPYHVNVMQKVPLSMERDAVTPAYLKDLRGIVLDHMHEEISSEQARGKWTSDAVEETGNLGAVRALVKKRFGDKVVTYDPSDREANNIATSQGYTVISGGTFTGDAWEKVREAKAALPAGVVTPSPKPFHPGGEPLKIVSLKDCTADMVRFASMVIHLALELEGLDVSVIFANDVEWRFKAAYTKVSDRAGNMTVNAGLLGVGFFLPASLDEQLRLFVHELGHHYGHHLEDKYHQALCRIAGNLAVAALDHPDWFGRK